MLSIEPRIVLFSEHVFIWSSSFNHMLPFWCPFLVDPHLATHHSNICIYIGAWLRGETKLCPLTLMISFVCDECRSLFFQAASFEQERLASCPWLTRKGSELNSHFCIEHSRKFSAEFVSIFVRDRKASHALFLEQGEKDDKIIAVCADDPEYRHFKDIKELPPHRLAEIRRFFEDCKSCSNTLVVIESIEF